jgi:hypothetical protein
MADTLLVYPPSHPSPQGGGCRTEHVQLFIPDPETCSILPPIFPRQGGLQRPDVGRQPGTGQSLVGRGLGDKHLPLKRQVVWFPLTRNPGVPRRLPSHIFICFRGESRLGTPLFS